MPTYAIKNLTQYNRPAPLKPQHCPYTPNPITYGRYNQATTPSDTSHYSMPLARNAYNKLLVASYTTPKQPI
jgi:hypothetical protein